MDSPERPENLFPHKTLSARLGRDVLAGRHGKSETSWYFVDGIFYYGHAETKHDVAVLREKLVQTVMARKYVIAGGVKSRS